jgi:hypothetical protein
VTDTPARSALLWLTCGNCRLLAESLQNAVDRGPDHNASDEQRDDLQDDDQAAANQHSGPGAPAARRRPTSHRLQRVARLVWVTSLRRIPRRSRLRCGPRLRRIARLGRRAGGAGDRSASLAAAREALIRQVGPELLRQCSWRGPAAAAATCGAAAGWPAKAPGL